MKRLFMLFLLVCAGNVFGAASSSSAAASSSSAAASSSSVADSNDIDLPVLDLICNLPKEQEPAHKQEMFSFMRQNNLLTERDLDRSAMTESRRSGLRKLMRVLNETFDLVLCQPFPRLRQVAILLDKGANPNFNQGDAERDSPLHIICSNGARFTSEREEIIQLLVQYKADVNTFDRSGRTPLALLCQRYGTSASDDQRSLYRAIQYLIMHGAHVPHEEAKAYSGLLENYRAARDNGDLQNLAVLSGDGTRFNLPFETIVQSGTLINILEVSSMAGKVDKPLVFQDFDAKTLRLLFNLMEWNVNLPHLTSAEKIDTFCRLIIRAFSYWNGPNQVYYRELRDLAIGACFFDITNEVGMAIALTVSTINRGTVSAKFDRSAIIPPGVLEYLDNLRIQAREMPVSISLAQGFRILFKDVEGLVCSSASYIWDAMKS